AALTGSNAPPPADTFDLHESARTVTSAFNIYVPYSNRLSQCELDQIGSGDAQPPDFSSFFAQAASGHHTTITGPTGFGPSQFVPLGQLLPYTVQFENAANATSAAAEARVVMQLDPSLDPRSFRLSDMRLGDIQLHIPDSRGAFQGDFDFTGSKGFILRVSAGVDVASHTATWLLQAIDPS